MNLYGPMLSLDISQCKFFQCKVMWMHERRVMQRRDWTRWKDDTLPPQLHFLVYFSNVFPTIFLKCILYCISQIMQRGGWTRWKDDTPPSPLSPSTTFLIFISQCISNSIYIFVKYSIKYIWYIKCFLYCILLMILVVGYKLNLYLVFGVIHILLFGSDEGMTSFLPPPI